jgi:hypothetical protein
LRPPRWLVRREPVRSDGASTETTEEMKTKAILPTTVAIVVSSILPLAAETKTTEKTETKEHADGSVTEKTTTKTRTFGPDVETKVVKYFDTYKTERFGLPPAIVTRVKVKQMPTAWRTTLAPGVVIQEKERVHLIDAPPELIKVLPAPSPDVHFYVAGSNVVAVDRDYRIVDSVNIPSIKIVADAD